MNKELQEYTQALKERKLLPKKMEFTRFKDWHIVNAYSREDNLAISENVSMGIDLNYEVAFAKALTEYQERNLLSQTPHLSFDLHEKSDGIAAFPKAFKNAHLRVRQNAYNEAVERYLWANWWDNPAIAHQEVDAGNLPHIKELIAHFDLKKISSIYIKHAPIPNASSVDLHILLAYTKNGGLITGGATGESTDSLEIFNRAFGELLRHLLVAEKFRTKSASPSSFYEERLEGFASGRWAEIAQARLQQRGNESLILPETIIDELIPHPHDDLVLIHRTLFKNQPQFVGGKLERLCL